MAKGNFINYIVSDDPNKYPSNGLHTDGYYYEAISDNSEGMYVWKKNEFGSELKEFNESVSTLPYAFYNGSAVVLNGEIHILGGMDNSTKHYKWNGTSWTSVSSLPIQFYHGSAVVLNNEIHILGGYATQAATKHYKWDGSSWTSVSTLPYSFYHGSAVIFNGEIHILGGDSTSAAQTSHYKWDGSSWTKVSTLPYKFYSNSAVVLNNEIHILGSSATSPYTQHYKWNGVSWTSVSTLPYNFNDGSAVVLNNEIHILGCYESSARNSHYKLNGSSWVSVGSLPIPFYRGEAVVYNNAIHILGSGSSNHQTAHYLVCGYILTYTFLDYIISNKENAYPNGGEKDGYYYELVKDVDFSQVTATAAEVLSGKTFFDSEGTLQTGTMGGVVFGTVKPSSTFYLTMTHNLGVKPKWFVALNGSGNSNGYTHGCAYNENYSTNVYVQGYYYTTTKSISTTQGSSSYAYIDESVITVPYYTSSYPWNTSNDVIWAAGY